MDEFWFTYTLLRDGRIVRKGKGLAPSRSADAVGAYLGRRYRSRRWHSYDFRWHTTESAALKAEERAIDGYERVVGHKPPWNVHRGGGGGTRYVRCRAALVDGRSCRNLALQGNYGFCGTHRA
jgi:hypothetical protein